jgi:hypothetical protein
MRAAPGNSTNPTTNPTTTPTNAGHHPPQDLAPSPLHPTAKPVHGRACPTPPFRRTCLPTDRPHRHPSGAPFPRSTGPAAPFRLTCPPPDRPDRNLPARRFPDGWATPTPFGHTGRATDGPAGRVHRRPTTFHPTTSRPPLPTGPPAWAAKAPSAFGAPGGPEGAGPRPAVPQEPSGFAASPEDTRRPARAGRPTEPISKDGLATVGLAR